MRWNTKPKPLPGDVKHQEKFAWLPVETNMGTTVWLERVVVLSIWDTPGAGYWTWIEAFVGKADMVTDVLTLAKRARRVSFGYEDKEFRFYRGSSWTAITPP